MTYPFWRVWQEKSQGLPTQVWSFQLSIIANTHARVGQSWNIFIFNNYICSLLLLTKFLLVSGIRGVYFLIWESIFGWILPHLEPCIYLCTKQSADHPVHSYLHGYRPLDNPWTIWNKRLILSTDGLRTNLSVDVRMA